MQWHYTHVPSNSVILVAELLSLYHLNHFALNNPSLASLTSFSDYVHDTLAIFYDNDEDVINDNEVQAW